MTIKDRVRAALKRNPDWKPREIAKATGLTRQQTYDAMRWIRDPDWYKRWRQTNPDQYRTANRARYLRKARAVGVRPDAEARAARRGLAEKLATPVQKHRAKGATYTQVGAKLGLTRNAVAGRLWRAKQREMRGQANRATA